MTNQIIGPNHTVLCGRTANYQGSVATHLAFQQMLDGTHVVQLCEYEADEKAARKQMAKLAEALRTDDVDSVLDRFHTITGLYTSVESVLTQLDEIGLVAADVLFLNDLSWSLPVVPNRLALTVASKLASAGCRVLTALNCAAPGAPLPDLKTYADTVWFVQGNYLTVTLNQKKPSSDLEITLKGKRYAHGALTWKELEKENV